jgi:hypothetical protein
MAASFRLNGLHIFLILLAVLLIGYLLNYTWESFQCGCGKEGFGNLEGYGEALSGYSTDNKKVVNLYGNVFFDPVGKNFIEVLTENELRITDNENRSVNHVIQQSNTFSLENVLWSSNTTNGSYAILSNTGILDVFDSGNQKVWSSPDPTDSSVSNSFLVPQNDGNLVIYKGSNPSENVGSLWSSNTHGRQGIANDTYKGTHGAVGQDFMKSGDRLSSGQWLGSADGSTVLKMNADGNLVLYGVSSSGTSSGENNYVVPTTTNNGKSFMYLGNNVNSEGSKTLACLYVPIQSASSSVSFIHVLDLEKTTFKPQKHIGTFYFNGTEVLSETVMQNIGDITQLNNLSAEFDKPLQEDLQSTPVNDNMSVVVSSTSNAVKVVAQKKETNGSSGFHALIAFSESGEPKMVAMETSAGTATTETNNDSTTKEGSSDCDLAKKMREYKELQETIFGFKEMKSSFFNYGSSDDYFLKTEVVPPVCPACPSCSDSNGCCGHRGGNSGNSGNGTSSNEKKSNTTNKSQSSSGTQSNSLIRDAGSGATNLIRDGASGADDLVRDAASGTTKLARDAVGGTYDVAKDVVSGTGEVAQNAASDAYGVAKDVTTGTVGLGREIVGGVFDTASNIVGGAVGLGKDVVGGTVGLGKDVVGGITKGIPNYGSPATATTRNSGPTTQMGGYQQSYGGGYSNPSYPPQTAGQDPYGYYGSVPMKAPSNYIARTADFSSFGK